MPPSARSRSPSTMRHHPKPSPAVPARDKLASSPAFTPHYVAGYVLSSCAAIAYGISPLMVRLAFDNAPQASVIAGGVIAYAAATVVFSFSLLRPAVRQDIQGLKRANVLWFFCSAVLVTASQGFVYASLAVAPLMVVT